jgi:hypothetical protein
MDIPAKDLIDLGIKAAVALYGAIWAYFLLHVLRQRELAGIAEVKGTSENEKLKIELHSLAIEKNLQLEKGTRELRKLDQDNERLERELARKSVIGIEIDPTVVKNPDGGGYIVFGVVTLTNLGNIDIRLPWEEQAPPVRLLRVRFHRDAQPDFDSVAEARVRMTSNPNADAPAHIIRSGSKEAVVFALHALDAGLYLLSFRAEGEPLEPDKTPSEKPARPRPWTANKYVLVGDAAVSEAAPAAA